MKIFISWSGERSKAVAESLRSWLPNVIQGLQPWMSANDIDKGARWGKDIALELEQARVGILCLTPENQEAPWMLFEAGALAKTLDQTFVCPYLIDLEPTDIKGPLVQFQAAKANKEDTSKLIKTINRAQKENALSESTVEKSFEKWWHDLEQELKNPPRPRSFSKRSEREMIEEILGITRDFARKNAQASINEQSLERMLTSVVTRALRNLR